MESKAYERSLMGVESFKQSEGLARWVVARETNSFANFLYIECMITIRYMSMWPIK